MTGRLLDASGNPIEGMGPVKQAKFQELESKPPSLREVVGIDLREGN